MRNLQLVRRTPARFGVFAGVQLLLATILVAYGSPATAALSASPNPNTGDYTVSWSSISGATEYRLEESTNGGSTWSGQYWAFSTNRSFTNKSPGAYTYRLKWCFERNIRGEYVTICRPTADPYVTVTVNAPAPPPTTPTGLTGPGTDYDGSYTISWNASSGSTSYRLEEKVGSGAWSQIYSGSATSRAISGKSSGTYSYRVRGCNVDAVCSSWSSTHVTTVAAAPAAPTGLTGPAVDANGSYTISWNASSGASSYQLQERVGSGSWIQIYSGSSLSRSISGKADGTYSYRVRACNAGGACSGWSSTHVVEVSSAPLPPATPPAPAPISDPGPASAAESDTIGAIAGDFRVNESGAANYSIPIAVATGTAGVAPQISLSYSSSASNGIAGIGWSLSGVSNINRCRQTYDQDRNVTSISWTTSDRFCLNGQRLLLESGASYGAANSTYRTEIDSGAIVTIKGNVNGEPDYFEVKRKDGSTTYYGKAPGSSDTSAKLTNGAGKTLTWTIRKFQDSVGNPMWFEYETVGSVQRISEIKYAYGPNAGPSGHGARLEFTYEARPDRTSGYVSGSFFENDQRLSAINSYNTVTSETLIRKYVLRYNEGINVIYDDLSRLTSVEECVGTTCLPRTTFSWRLPKNSTTISTIASTSMSSSLAVFTPADINGDGMMDLAWLQGNGQNKTLKYALSTGSGFTLSQFSNGSTSLSVTSSTTNPKLKAIDYNLDGRQDLIYWDDGADLWKVVVAEPYGDGGWRLKNLKISTPISSWNTTFADVDSNGTTDAVYKLVGAATTVYLRLLEIDQSQPLTSYRRYAFGNQIQVGSPGYLTTVGQIRAVAGDYNGDGRVDIAMGGQYTECEDYWETPQCTTTRNYRALTFNNVTSTTASLSSYHQFPPVFVNSVLQYPVMNDMQAGDVNADGLSDAFYPVKALVNSNGPSQYALKLNRGNGQFDHLAVTDSSLTNEHADPQLVDWNMDGFQDVMWRDTASGGRIRVRYWNPDNNTLDPAVVVTYGVSGHQYETVSYFDVNGDAAPDIVRINANGTIGSVNVLSRKVGSTIVFRAINRIESIVNGLGAKTQIVYEPLSYTDHYDRLEVSTTPGTVTVCENLGHPGEEACWEEPAQVAEPGSFYAAINGDWDLISGAQTLGKNAPVLEMAGPMFVVTDVIGSSPTAGNSPGNVDTLATTTVSYRYSAARLQAAGRGLLGFETLTSIDNQSGVETTTRYRQDWPFIGYPIFTEVRSSAGNTLSKTTTDWQIIEWTSGFSGIASESGTAALGALHVVEVQSGEQNFDLAGNGASQGSLLSTVSTTTTYDGEANVTGIEVTNRDASGNAVKTVDTQNTYLNDGNFTLFEGRLSQTLVTTTLNGTAAPVRRSTFDYHASGNHRGLLWRETTEPGSSYELRTTHSYDSFGNRIRSATTGGGETRCNVDKSVYGARGRYVDSVYDCLGRKLSTIVSRNAFGSPTVSKSYTDLNGTDYVSTHVSYGAMGREYYRYRSDGAGTTKYLTLDLSYCPAGTAYKATTFEATGAARQECFDILGRSVRSMKSGFDGAWDARDTEYDAVGRIANNSEPFDLSSANQVAPHWTRLTYDVLGRVTQTTLPDGTSGSKSYNGLTTITTNNASPPQSRTEIKNVLGEVTDVYDNLGGHTRFAYNHQGAMILMVDPAGNETTTEYDLVGRKIETDDPDKGRWTYTYNAFGDLKTQTDAKGQTHTMTYDGLGRMLTRVDSSGESDSAWHYDTSPYGLGQLDYVEDHVSGYMRTMIYDSMGRPSETVTTFDGKVYYEKSTYDEFGRIFQAFDAAGDGSYADHGVVNTYNEFGYLESLTDAISIGGVPRTVYRQVVAMDFRDQVTSEHRGIDNVNGNSQPSVTTTFTYDNATGRLLSIDGLNASGLDVQDLNYAWSAVGNLLTRHEASGSKNLTESFQYDNLNRLISQTVSGQSSVTVAYDSIGNITSKSNVGSYSYGAGIAGPHAVTSANGVSYGYDENGNNINGDGRTIQYTAFDKPSVISKSGHTISFAYDPDRRRYRRIDANSSGSTTTYYVGSVEIIFRPDGDQERKRYIGGVAIETVYFGGNSVEDYREAHYQHRDHLGSLDVLTDSSGDIVQEFSFDAWGKRRNATNWQALSASQLINFDHSLTTRGFTNHEMLDEVGIIHMGGRIYDPRLGRFLQADPYIQDPSNTQALNRYSYVQNNPLNATDPSGYFINFLIGALIGAIVGKIGQELDIPFLSAIGNMLACGMSGGIGCAAGFSFAATLGAGGSFADALKNGVLAGLSAAAFSQIGEAFDGVAGFWKEGGLGHIGAHAATGGIMSVLQGGKFGHGFLSAGITKAINLNKLMPGSNRKLDISRTVVAAVVGGSVSRMTGGKFSNGAITAAFAQAYNGNGAERRRVEEERRSLTQWLDEKILEFFIEHDLPSLPQGVVDGTTGLADGTVGGLSFGIVDMADVRDSLGIDGGVNTESTLYSVGQTTGGIVGGSLWGGAIGLAGRGVKGFEYSHFVPYRFLKPHGISRQWRSMFNGTYVPRWYHAATDKFRWRFMPRAGVAKMNFGASSPIPQGLQQVLRIPPIYWGAAAGSTVGD